MLNDRKKLEETKVAICLIKSMSGSIPEEALEIQEILERLIAAEEKHPRDFGKQFVEDALRTESPPNADVLDRLANNARLLHAAMGLCTEAGEFLDALKKHIFYGKILDTVNIIEECGDFLWYLAIVSSDLDTPIEKMMERVIAKLRKRYADKFSSNEAIHRDLDAERKILERSGQ